MRSRSERKAAYCHRTGAILRWPVPLACAAVLAPTTSAGAVPPQRFEPKPPNLLPGDARAARVAAAPSSWLVGARPGARTERIAGRFRARLLMRGTGSYRVARSRARGFAAALRRAGRYAYAEPDAYARRQAFPLDELGAQQWGLGQIGATAFDPPPVLGTSPLLGVLEGGLDQTHPDVQGIGLDGSAYAGGSEGLLHGTAVASVAAAPANGRGMVGVWPGARTTVFSSNSNCADAVSALMRALDAGAQVLNMSYGFPNGGCFSHYIATQLAYGNGVVLVAAAGNDFLRGNPADGRPATDPHVITVAALNPDLSSADFSNENYAVDLSAPGVGVLAAVPQNLDVEDNARDGYMALDGTSFSAPLVAGGAAWVMQQRDNLDNTQVTDLVRFATRDLGREGWDETFGFGVFDLPTALSDPAPVTDPLEPNDNIPWINGKYFGGADDPIYKGRSAGLSARLDALEDPADVYRVVLPGRSAVQISVRPRYGDPDLAAYNGWAKTVFSRRGLISSSQRSGRRLDRIEYANPYRRRFVSYVRVWPDTLDAGYRLTLRRVRY